MRKCLSERKSQGITLIALIVTIIVLLILAGVAVAMLSGENGLLERAKLSKERQEEAINSENSNLSDYEKEIEKYMEDSNYESDNNDKVINNNLKAGIVADGSWDTTKKVNTPKLEGTGLIAIYYDNSGNMVELTKDSSDEAWNSWYDYTANTETTNNASHWANAITKGQDEAGNEIITGYWVWIPRYAYQIADNLGNGGSGVSGTINIKFLQGTGYTDEDGTNINGTYEIEQTDESDATTKRMKNYVVHPSFRDGTSTNCANGEWRAEIPGYWVAKYEAGFQECTQTLNNGTATEPTLDSTALAKVVYSNSTYSSFHPGYATNALSQTLTSSATSNNKLSYPVFKPLTYSYNNISVGDMFTISRQIQNASTFYGLSNVDSHMMKNSEWGAVAYLTQSSYGRNKTEITQNTKNLNNKDSKYIYAVTGYAEDTANGVNASSTGNMTGVFDLSGGTTERTAAYITNTQGASVRSARGGSFATATTSSEYLTVYPYDSTSDSSDSSTNNYNEYAKLKTTRYGDAILETSNSGSRKNSWNGDYSYFPYKDAPFFYHNGVFASVVTYEGSYWGDYPQGYPCFSGGFRVVLVSSSNKK